jgi:hypothetical protein
MMHNSPPKSFLNQDISPYKQGAVAFGIALVMMLLSTMTSPGKYSKIGHIAPWVALCGVILFFAIANSVLSLADHKNKLYWMQSIISFAFLLIAGGFIAYLISGVGIYDAGSVSWIYVVFTIGYLVFLSIVNLIKFFVALAQRQDKRLRGEE